MSDLKSRLLRMGALAGQIAADATKEVVKAGQEIVEGERTAAEMRRVGRELVEGEYQTETAFVKDTLMKMATEEGSGLSQEDCEAIATFVETYFVPDPKTVIEQKIKDRYDAIELMVAKGEYMKSYAASFVDSTPSILGKLLKTEAEKCETAEALKQTDMGRIASYIYGVADKPVQFEQLVLQGKVRAAARQKTKTPETP